MYIYIYMYIYICICIYISHLLFVTFHILVKSLISGASRHLLPGGSVVARSPVKWQKVAVFTGKPWESHGKAMGKQWIAYPLRLYKTVCELEHLPLIVDLTINSMVIFHSYSGFSYWKWPLIVDLTIKHGDFPIRFLELFTRPVVIKTRCRWLRESQRESQSVSRAKLFGDKKRVPSQKFFWC